MIETLDDVTAEGLDALELIHLKHHDQKKLKSLTDKSEDVWKTVRAWSVAIQKGTVDAANAKFFLLTTAPSSNSSMLAEHLSAPRRRVETQRHRSVQRDGRYRRRDGCQRR